MTSSSGVGWFEGYGKGYRYGHGHGASSEEVFKWFKGFDTCAATVFKNGRWVDLEGLGMLMEGERGDKFEDDTRYCDMRKDLLEAMSSAGRGGGVFTIVFLSFSFIGT